MAELKTKPTGGDVEAFIDSIESEQKRDDARELLKIMKEVTGDDPVMWGPSIIGYGNYHYVYESGREGDWMLAGFSPRKQNLTIYIMGGFENQEEYLKKIGKAKNSVGCLYVKKLSDIDLGVLKKMIHLSVETVKKRYAPRN